MERFNDSEGWRWYADSLEEFLGGNAYASVTNILKVVNNPSLEKWFIKNTADAIDKRRTESASVGTEIHNMLEANLMGKDDETLVAKYPAAFDRWLEWRERNVTGVISGDTYIRHERFGYAGACDAVLEVQGEPVVVDFKTGSIYDRMQHDYKEWPKQIKPSISMQIAAYRRALIDGGEYTDSLGAAVLRLSADGKELQYTAFRQHNACFEAFLAALELFRFTNFNKLKYMNWKFLGEEIG